MTEQQHTMIFGHPVISRHSSSKHYADRRRELLSCSCPKAPAPESD